MASFKNEASKGIDGIRDRKDLHNLKTKNSINTIFFSTCTIFQF